MFKTFNGRFKEGIIWWDQEIHNASDVDVFFFIHDYKGRAKYKYKFRTLQIDLNKNINQIKAGYKSNLRNELKRAKTFGFKIKQKTKLSQKELSEYLKIYNLFADFKNLPHTSKELLNAMNESKQFLVTYIYKNHELISVHSFYHDKKSARLYHSFSTNNSLSNKENGLANKLLTHNDIIFLKNNNFSIYDAGGIGNFDGDNSIFEGIIRFKKAFGGKEVVLWKGVTPNGEQGEKIYSKYWLKK